MNKKKQMPEFSLEDIQKAKTFVECLDGYSLTFMVQHMLREHSDVFLPLITFERGGKE